MTIYTCMPLETVLNGIDAKRENLHEVWVGGIHMQVEAVAPGIGRIVRLLQCDLHHYLDPMLAPGAIVHYGGASRFSDHRE